MLKSRLPTLLTGSVLGVTLEFYDFFIFGFAAASVFPRVFFPNLAPSIALVFSFLIFGAGFPARLFGSFLFGHIGDRIGRRFSFVATICLVGLSTCAAAALPGYATLGLAAPILLILLRVIQGIGLGGEFGGSTSLLAEYALDHRHRTLILALANAGIPAGAMAAGLAMYLLSDSFAANGWRVAMAGSLIIFVPAVLARLRIADSPVFEVIKAKDNLSRFPSISILKTHSRAIVLIALIFSFQQMNGYVSSTYMISFMSGAGIPLATIGLIIFVSRIGDLVGIALGGLASKHFGRRAIVKVAVISTVIFSVPICLSILDKNIVAVFVFQLLVTFFGVGILHAIAPIIASENFPTKYRHSGSGVAYNLSAMIGGMLAPATLAVLVGHDLVDRWQFVPFVYLIYGIISLSALFMLKETQGVSLRELDD